MSEKLPYPFNPKSQKKIDDYKRKLQEQLERKRAIERAKAEAERRRQEKNKPK